MQIKKNNSTIVWLKMSDLGVGKKKQNMFYKKNCKEKAKICK